MLLHLASAVPVPMKDVDGPQKLRQTSIVSKLGGSACAGILEIGLFYPIDTVAKRLMTNEAKSWSKNSLDRVVFNREFNKSFEVGVKPTVSQRFRSLYPGLGFAAVYKVIQRMYRFGLQPTVFQMIDDSAVGDALGENKPLKNAVAGSLMGVGEVMLLPLDVLKIKAQTNPTALQGRGFFRIIAQEGIPSLYQGWAWTAIRNVPGSFALFGGNSFMKELLMEESQNGRATFMQNFLGSTFGSIFAIAISHPADVIKTRIQNRSFERPETGRQILRNMLTKEGPRAFVKGFSVKAIVVGPKLVFSFTVAQSLTGLLDSWMEGREGRP